MSTPSSISYNYFENFEDFVKQLPEARYHPAIETANCCSTRTSDLQIWRRIAGTFVQALPTSGVDNTVIL